MNVSKQDILAIYQQPFSELLYQAQTIHRSNFDNTKVQPSILCNIKGGRCPEKCNYCSQSAHFKTDFEDFKLIAVDEVIRLATKAKAEGAHRFCMGGAWRSPPAKAMPLLIEMIKEVKKLGLETCLTAGLLDAEQVQKFEDAGLDYYNHNIDTSPEYYSKIITTRTFQDRLQTLKLVRDSKIKICCGVILGLGETESDRVDLLHVLANFPRHPESVPVNKLVPIPGTPLENIPPIHILDLVRFVACARILMPKSFLRLSAGRNSFSDAEQALALIAGINSMHLGSSLLTTKLPGSNKDKKLFDNLNMQLDTPEEILNEK